MTIALVQKRFLKSNGQAFNYQYFRWKYLEPIFGRGLWRDVQEAQRFQHIDEEFRDILSQLRRDPRVVKLNYISGLNEIQIRLLEQLNESQRRLNRFLEVMYKDYIS